MTDLKKKFTVNRDDEKTFKRVFKNGEELNIVSYNVPRISKKYQNGNMTADIMEFVNYKSKQMAKSDRFKNGRIGVAIEYEGTKKSKWTSTSYVSVGDSVTLEGWEDYNDDVDDEGYGDIISFQIQYYL